MDLRSSVPDQIEAALISAVNAVASEPESQAWDNPTWTRHVKNAAARLGLDYKNWVCASGCDHANEGEWLYDLLWLEYDGPNLKAATLALECEWDPSGLEDDFLKLVLARSDHRAFIFDTAPAANRRAVVDHLLRNVRSCRHTSVGDRYLFGAWNNADRCFEWLAYEVAV